MPMLNWLSSLLHSRRVNSPTKPPSICSTETTTADHRDGSHTTTRTTRRTVGGVELGTRIEITVYRNGSEDTMVSDLRNGVWFVVSGGSRPGPNEEGCGGMAEIETARRAK